MAGSTAGALSIACSLSAMIYALGDVSGSVLCVALLRHHVVWPVCHHAVKSAAKSVKCIELCDVLQSDVIGCEAICDFL